MMDLREARAKLEHEAKTIADAEGLRQDNMKLEARFEAGRRPPFDQPESWVLRYGEFELYRFDEEWREDGHGSIRSCRQVLIDTAQDSEYFEDYRSAVRKSLLKMKKASDTRTVGFR